MKKNIFDKVRLNNGYEIPCYYIGPAHPVWSDKAKNDGKVDGTGFATVDVSGATIEDVMHTALECGVRGFDTGARYGTEEDIGKFFRTCGLPRKELFVTTKVNNIMQGYDNTMIDFENSMKKLGLDYVDVYMIHCPVPQRGLYVDTWRAFEEIYRSGRAKAIAVSNFNVQHFYDLAEVSDIVPAINQIEQHPFYVQENLKAYEKKHGIVSMSYSPLGQGRFAKDPRLAWMAEKYGKTIAQIILRWHVQKGFIPVTRSSNPKRVKENAEIFDFDIEPADMAFLEALNHHDRVWHMPDRFPGTYAHVHTEDVFRKSVEEELNAPDIPAEKREEIRSTVEQLLTYQDIDGTKDYIIWCFTHAVAVYGPRADIEDCACKMAQLHAKHLVRGMAGLRKPTDP